MKPTVSVIMANFNGARFVGAAIASVVCQTLRSWELIVIDDASTDDSVAVAIRAAGGDSRVRVVRQMQNGGAAAARNRGIEVAEGEWIAIFDSDDLMLPHRLEQLIRRANSDGAAIVADNFLVFSDDEKPTGRHLRGSKPRWIGLAEFIHSTCIYSAAPDLGFLKPMIRTETIRALRARYDERLRLGEDFNFLAKLLAKGERLRVDPSPMHLYRKHANSLSKRMTAAALRASLAADQEWAKEHALSGAEMRALRRRRHSLETALTYERVMQDLKARETAHALALTASNPRIWYYLARALANRASRKLSRSNQARGGTAPSERLPAGARASERNDLFVRMDDTGGATVDARSSPVFSTMKEKSSP